MARKIEVTCNGCGVKQAFNTWQSLNASLNPEAKEALLKGELTRFACKECGTSAEVVYPLLYHDMERQLMFWFVAGDGVPEAATPPKERFMDGYQFRIVKTRNQLVEKIRIFEAGLDDRVLEFAKLMLRHGAANAGRTLVGELLFNGRGKTEAGEAAIGFVLLAPDGPEPLTTLVSQINAATRELAGKLPPLESESGKWIVVDECYAVQLVNKL